MSYIRLEEIEKQYGKEAAAVKAVKGINLTIDQGEFVSIMGESGSGKSTLLSMLGGLNSPSGGRVFIDGVSIYSLDPEKRADFRRSRMGFVFQSFHLISYLTVAENVMLPLSTEKIRAGEKRKMAHDVLEKIGLRGKADRLPGEVSGGEQERVALARAIVNHPSVLFADEPTGNLDHSTSQRMMELFGSLNREGMTIVMVTHSAACSRHAHRILTLSDGCLSDDETVRFREQTPRAPGDNKSIRVSRQGRPDSSQAEETRRCRAGSG